MGAVMSLSTDEPTQGFRFIKETFEIIERNKRMEAALERAFCDFVLYYLPTDETRQAVWNQVCEWRKILRGES